MNFKVFLKRKLRKGFHQRELGSDEINEYLVINVDELARLKSGKRVYLSSTIIP